MARGRLVLDETVLELERPLRELNIIVLAPPRGWIEALPVVCLSGRILVTCNAKDFVAEATAYEYGLIGVPRRLLAAPPSAAKIVSRAIVEHGLWALGHSFVLNLKTGRLRDLWAEEQGERKR